MSEIIEKTYKFLDALDNSEVIKKLSLSLPTTIEYHGKSVNAIPI